MNKAKSTDEGTVEVNIVQAASMYSSSDHFDMKSFRNLIHDLLCLREGTLFQPRAIVTRVSDAIAEYVDVPTETQKLDIVKIVELFNNWDKVMRMGTVIESGGSKLPSLQNYETLEQLVVLRKARSKEKQLKCAEDKPSPSKTTGSNLQWVYSSGPGKGSVVPSYCLLQEKKWRFCDHGDGTGALYWWPGRDTKEGISMLSQGEFKAVLVEKIDVNDSSTYSRPQSARIIGREISEPKEASALAQAIAKEVQRIDTVSPVDINLEESKTAGRNEAAEVLCPMGHPVVLTDTPESGWFDSYWRCACARQETGCLSGYFARRELRYSCSAGCNWDICGPCRDRLLMMERYPRDGKDPCEDVDRRLKSLGMHSVEVGSGGDCFFRCLTAQHPWFCFEPSAYNSLLARIKVIDHMAENRKLYESFVAYDDVTTDYDEYIRRMYLPTTWIEGGIEVIATAEVWNVNIHIYGVDESHDRVVCPQSSNIDTRDVFMVHYYDYHYRVVEYIR